MGVGCKESNGPVDTDVNHRDSSIVMSPVSELATNNTFKHAEEGVLE